MIMSSNAVWKKNGVETLLVNNVELKVKRSNIKTDWIIFLLFTTEE